MPLQNRVTPDGTIIAHPSRGTMMGNRGGCLHDHNKSLGARRWITRQWISCRLQFKDRHRQVMHPRRYTELFFLDEATALAAGHRPCFECRRTDAVNFSRLWSIAVRAEAPCRARASDIDRSLHAERLEPDGGKRTWFAPVDTLPDGTMVRLDNGEPQLVLSDRLLAWNLSGYRPPKRVAAGTMVEVLTPRSIIGVLKLGYQPMLHESAHDLR